MYEEHHVAKERAAFPWFAGWRLAAPMIAHKHEPACRRGDIFQTRRPLVIPPKSIAAVFTGNADCRHFGGLVFS
jgi:hypothetical protein